MEDESPKPSAVLLLLYCRDGEPHMVFTKRTNNVSAHKGQISFPGGSVEDYDATFVDTALREATEELGVSLEDAVVIFRLDDFLAQGSNYQITPIVACVREQPVFKPDPFEVAEVFDVPLSYLLNVVTNGEHRSHSQDAPPWPEFRYNGHVIWGATGRILERFLIQYCLGEIKFPDGVFAMGDREYGSLRTSR